MENNDLYKFLSFRNLLIRFDSHTIIYSISGKRKFLKNITSVTGQDF